MRLPIVSARDLIKTLAKVGYLADHQSGSHIILRNKNYPYRKLTIPNQRNSARNFARNNKSDGPIKRGVLKTTMRCLGTTL